MNLRLSTPCKARSNGLQRLARLEVHGRSARKVFFGEVSFCPLHRSRSKARKFGCGTPTAGARFGRVLRASARSWSAVARRSRDTGWALRSSAASAHRQGGGKAAWRSASRRTSFGGIQCLLYCFSYWQVSAGCACLPFRCNLQTLREIPKRCATFGRPGIGKAANWDGPLEPGASLWGVRRESRSGSGHAALAFGRDRSGYATSALSIAVALLN